MTITTYKIIIISKNTKDKFLLKKKLINSNQIRFEIIDFTLLSEALSTFKEIKIDACMLDCNFSNEDINAFFQEIKEIGYVCPIIIIADEYQCDPNNKFLELGAVNYLTRKELTSSLTERALYYAIKQSKEIESIYEAKANAIQQDRFSSIELLASSLAHEIGTPLAIIRGRAELANKREIENLSFKNDMETIIKQIDRITKLVNSLLNLARGPQSEVTSKININKVIQDVLSLIEIELQQKNIILNYQINKEYSVQAESGPLGQILLNLLTNSIHAIAEEKKTGRKNSHQIELYIVENLNSIDLVVTDSGCGISKENLKQIFKPFFTTKQIGSGTGLGLATTYKILQSWGGIISVSSLKNIGTSFTVRLLKS